jgi:acetyl-CoA acetyltransferase
MTEQPVLDGQVPDELVAIVARHGQAVAAGDNAATLADFRPDRTGQLLGSARLPERLDQGWRVTQVRNVPGTPPVIAAAGPRDDGLDQPHREGLRAGQVRIQRCAPCGHWIWAPQALCPRCHSFDLTWPVVEPTGAVYSWTRTWQAFSPELSGHVPFVIVLAELAAVACGQAEHVIVYRGITEADDGRQSYGKGHFPPLLSAHGVLTPVQVCALRTQRMLEVDGVPRSALEALVQASYYHAQRNPDAVAYGRPLDHETYADSRWVSEPLRLYDCSRENDGAAAVLVTSAERARDLRQAPAFVLSGVQGAGPDWSESAENNAAYTSAGFHPAMVARLWAQAGVKAVDVDVVQVYENFSGPAAASLIDLGLCPPGAEAGSFMTVPNLIAPGGTLPVNTAGGNLAEGFVHGIGLVLEAVRQIRGTSAGQVPGADVSLLLGGPAAPLVSATVFGSAATI